MTGIAVATIRNWEERYGIVVPARGRGGQRVYSRDQVDRLHRIAQHVDRGLSPGDAHRLVEGGDGIEHEGAEAGRRRKLMILLAERDPYAAEFSEFFLRTEGYEVGVAFDPAVAEETVEEASPDLVVVEWLIGGGIGGRLCRDIRARSDRPILVISALAAEDAAIEAGADAFLQKPLDPLLFVSTVKDLLGESAFLRAKGAVPA
jgi:CheY-like chemotaxis protein